MSIFVSIPSIGNEPELLPTIKSVLAMAARPEDVYIGVSIIGNKKQYEELKEEFSEQERIRFLFTDYIDENGKYNIGVGLNRNLALSLYNNQHYMLQIDPHSRMMLGWDGYLINKLNDVKKFVNNEKVILTGTPARYTYEKYGKTEWIENYFQQFLGYSYWDNKEKYRGAGRIPRWSHRHIQEHIDENLIYKEIKQGFLPVPKVCAAFMFGSITFPYEYSLDKDILFWEEEIFQSIELIDRGFTLVHPGSTPVVSHLYSGDINFGYGQRDTLFGILHKISGERAMEVETEYTEKMLNNWDKYMNNPNNAEKIRRFENYNNFRFKEVIHDLYTYPKDFINCNYLPLPI